MAVHHRACRHHWLGECEPASAEAHSGPLLSWAGQHHVADGWPAPDQLIWDVCWAGLMLGSGAEGDACPCHALHR